jgi:Fur family ferric uptake transcriptional regulator
MAGRKLTEEKELFYTYLRQNGMKKTRQKDLILETFLTTEGHLSVEDTYSLVKKKDKKVGIVTVFRTLKTLTSCGIAREITLGDGLTRFEHSYHHPHHHHIVCTECHKAIEFVSPELESIQDQIVRRYHFKPLHHRMQIYGICEDCREQRPVLATPKHDTEKIFARDALRMAISMETRGITFYCEAARRNQHPEGRDILERIAEEEKRHLAELEGDLSRINRMEKGLESAPVFLHFDPSELERLVPNLEEYESHGLLNLDARRSLEVAMVLERRAAEFFQGYAEKFLETKGKRIFLQFAEEEQRHFESIRRRAEELLPA